MTITGIKSIELPRLFFLIPAKPPENFVLPMAMDVELPNGKIAHVVRVHYQGMADGIDGNRYHRFMGFVESITEKVS